MSNRSRDRSARISRRRFAMTYHGSGGVPPATFLTAADCVKWNSIIIEGNESDHAEDMTFFVVQTEKGEEDGRVHYQAYVEFKKRVEWSTVKKIFGERVHLEAARAGSSANIRYCTKNDTRYTDGNLCINGQWGTPRKGGGTTMAAIKILNGAGLETIVDQHPDLALLHMGKIEGLIAYAKGPRENTPKGVILYGLTGCGKTQYCMKRYGTKGTFWVSPPQGGRVWFGGYYGQDVAIFDEFTSGWFQLTYLLRLFDSTPLMVQPKNHEVPFNSETLVFTSNVDPRDWYAGYGESSEESNVHQKKMHKDALERRIQDFFEIYDCTKEVVMTPRGACNLYKRVKRTEIFRFRSDGGMDFSDMDQPGGNGFPLNGSMPFADYGQ